MVTVPKQRKKEVCQTAKALPSQVQAILAQVQPRLPPVQPGASGLLVPAQSQAVQVLLEACQKKQRRKEGVLEKSRLRRSSHCQQLHLP